MSVERQIGYYLYTKKNFYRSLTLTTNEELMKNKFLPYKRSVKSCVSIYIGYEEKKFSDQIKTTLIIGHINDDNNNLLVVLDMCMNFWMNKHSIHPHFYLSVSVCLLCNYYYYLQSSSSFLFVCLYVCLFIL